MGRPRLRFATDCSGCDAAAFALRSTTFCKQHRIRLRHRWASDINPIARQFILNRRGFPRRGLPRRDPRQPPRRDPREGEGRGWREGR